MHTISTPYEHYMNTVCMNTTSTPYEHYINTMHIGTPLASDTNTLNPKLIKGIIPGSLVN